MNSVAGKVAVVTGSGNGMGKAIAMLLAAEGAKVVVNDLAFVKDKNKYAADLVVEEIKALGGEAVANYDDISKLENDEKIIRTAIDSYGRIDILACVAGVVRSHPVDEVPESEWEFMMNVNAKSIYGLTKYAVPHMKQQHSGRIVIFSSRAAFGSGLSITYSAAKGAALSMAHELGYELVPYGIKVNAVLPSAVTGMFPQERVAYGGTPKPDPAGPDMVAPMVTYLCSDACVPYGEAFWVAGCDVGLYPRERKPVGLIRKGNKERWTVDELCTMIPETFDWYFETKSGFVDFNSK
ncbi:MAG: SDR family NAD(P)-dependent oxidoreductase [Oscillospiraceae bacterium]|nr:SDR family NAD(P)-dependent oxidoreductase [Oscillospiraceae bacterium]